MIHTIGNYRNEETAKQVAGVVRQAVGRSAKITVKRLDLNDNHIVRANIVDTRITAQMLEDVADLAFRIHLRLKPTAK